MIYETIYRKLSKLVPNLAEIEEYAKLTAPGYMDLGIDVIDRNDEYTVIALSHYYKHPSGDMIPDPDMEVRITHELQMAEAMSYQDTFGYQQVYHDWDTETQRFRKVAPRAKKELNSFLNKWLTNLLQQGHAIADKAGG